MDEFLDEMTRPHFLGCDASYEEADTVIFGAPFDSTASFRPGTRFAPNALRADSLIGFETYSPYLDRDMSELKVCDLGDVFAPLGNPQEMLDILERRTARILADGKRPVMIGGEHLLTQGTVKAVLQKAPDLHIFHFDAHTDLRERFLGQELSHANVIRKCQDMIGEDGRIHSFGIRSGGGDEFVYGRKHLDFHCFDVDACPASVAALMKKQPDVPVYVTIDVDVLDPSVMPGTGTPEAGGVSFKELMEALFSLAPLNIIAFDIMELSPPCDTSGISNAATWKILREMLLLSDKSRR